MHAEGWPGAGGGMEELRRKHKKGKPLAVVKHIAFKKTSQKPFPRRKRKEANPLDNIQKFCSAKK